jgi:hypothetical protein
VFLKAPLNLITLLGYPISKAIQASNKWKTERSLAEITIECFTILVPKGQNEDITINLLVGRVKGLEMLNIFIMEWIWSASQSH